MTPAAIPYSPDVEIVEADETETVAKLNQSFDEILEATSRDYGHAVRAVHAKAHAVLEGTLTVAEGLSPELAQGMFSRTNTHPVFIRVSTNAGDLLEDAISLPRGMAIKVLGVEGDRLPAAQGTTQDFVFVNGPVFQTKTSALFLGNLKMLAKTTDVADGGKAALSTVLRGLNKALTAVGIESPKLNSLSGAPNVDPLGQTYFSVTPFRYGDYMAKFRVRPVSLALTSLETHEIDASKNPDAIRDTIRSEMKTLDGEWAFEVQLCRDLEKQPIEDPTVEWKEEEFPFQIVATLQVRRQDSWDAERVQRIDEATRFSVWTGLAAHRPLGNINRARKDTYRHSADFRERFNRCPIHEPALP